MRCGACGGDTPDGKRFCKHCGAAVEAACASCGAELSPDSRFCVECGLPVAGGGAGERDGTAGTSGTGGVGGSGLPDARTPPRGGAGQPTGPARTSAAPVSERRWVTVLFCDLVGFTTLSEGRDAEEVRELLSSYFDVARAVVDRYGGTIEKFIGDAVMAAWGVPSANEDDAERAVRAALDLVGAIERLGQDLGVATLSARAGVLSGEAAVNLEAVGQGMVAGDLVNTASRLQSAAASGQVLVGDATYLAANDAIAFEDAGELTLKGKTEPVRAWHALRVVAQRKGVGKSEAIEPPFVGRDEELRLLTELLHATEREGSLRFASVTGVAGVGKSRLAWELLKYVDGLVDDVYWHHGRSPAYGEGVTFFALAEMVRMRCGIAEGEDEGGARRKLAACVEEFVTDDAERRWIEPRLAYLLALGDAPPGDHQELMSAWRTFFERIAAVAPVVMVFEDLHWADAGLLDYVESVAEWSRNFPIYVVTLARPEFKERRPTWGTSIRNFASLHLDPLSDAAVRELVVGLVPGLPGDAVDRLVERAEGIPLYAVETVRALSDRGVLVRSGGIYEVSGEGQVAEVDLPDTLHALIASRLDGLGRDARALVLDASVLGKTFTLGALSAVSGEGETSLSSSLSDLVHREVLALDADPRSPERGQYGFLQAVVREVAYSTLSKPDRRVKHLAAAHHFESLQDDELAGVVANHYLEAHRASRAGPEADTVAAKARDWLGQACERARSLGSSEEALSYAEEALGVAPPGPERAGLLELAGETAADAEELDRAFRYLEQAIAYYDELGDPVGAGRATALLTRALRQRGRFAAGIERAEAAFDALDEAAGPGADGARAWLAQALSASCEASGAATTALQWAEKALTFAERIDDPVLLARALDARAVALFDLGRHREALLLVGCELELAVVAGSLREQCHAKNLESILIVEDDPPRALAAALEAAELARRAGVRGDETTTMLNAAENATYIGDWGTARSVLAELDERRLPERARNYWGLLVALLEGVSADPARALEALVEISSTWEASESVAQRTTYLKARALAHLAAFQLEEAFSDAAAVVALDPAGFNSAQSISIQAHAALWRGDVAGAESALAGMERFRGRWMSAVRLTTEAGVAAIAGRVPEAVARYRSVAETWRALRTPFDLAICALDAAIVLAPTDQPAELIVEGRELIGRIGSAPFLAVLDRYTSRADGPAHPESAVGSVRS